MNHYTVYKITNLVNSRYYIGKHQTKDLDDGYMGSGKLIRAAIKKYGPENFKKEILFVFETEQDMNTKEAELVTEELIASGSVYNLCPGGRGGWGYINSVGLNVGHHQDPAYLKKVRQSNRNRIYTPLEDSSKEKISIANKGKQFFLGKKHSASSKRKMSDAKRTAVCSKNSQYGTMWITNGTENRKIKKDLDSIPEGWYKGRKITLV